MGVTNINSLVNNSAAPASLQDYENPTKPGNSCTAQPLMVAACEMWIPWCTSVGDFNAGHYIELHTKTKTYWIWQENYNWQDKVRYNTERWYKLDAPGVPGYSGVDGNRSITVNSDESFTVNHIG